MDYEFENKTTICSGTLFSFKEKFQEMGNKALIVTAKSSSKNGSLNDVIEILKELKVSFSVFDEIEENPSIENVKKGGKMGYEFGADFVIGIGGGSPMDGGKAIATIVKNPNISDEDLLKKTGLEYIPIVLIPTTFGTGSEVTPFSILTDHRNETKSSMAQFVCAKYAFLDSKYAECMPVHVAKSTATDAMSHLIEGYLSAKSTILTDIMCEGAFVNFADCKNDILNGNFNKEICEKLLNISTLAGLVITSTRTSLPHLLGYSLTYYKEIPHGFACGLLLGGYLEMHENKYKVNRVLELLGFGGNIDEFKKHFRNVIKMNKEISEDDIKKFTEKVMKNPAKLKTYPFEITIKDVKKLYRSVNV